MIAAGPQSTDQSGRGEDFVESGSWGDVRYAARTSGAMEAKEWMDSATDSERSKFSHLFQKIAASGRISNEEQFRHLDDGIWEFKRDGNRILCFQHGRCWRLTHHYPKSKQKCPQSEIVRAKNIRTEYFQALKTE